MLTSLKMHGYTTLEGIVTLKMSVQKNNAFQKKLLFLHLLWSISYLVCNAHFAVNIFSKILNFFTQENLKTVENVLSFDIFLQFLMQQLMLINAQNFNFVDLVVRYEYE